VSLKNAAPERCIFVFKRSDDIVRVRHINTSAQHRINNQSYVNAEATYTRQLINYAP
jgi:uncharacterized C2H2 Zn-finger protein